jgi:1-acyl-sn-glycerol-3-phosphate acyltransferase
MGIILALLCMGLLFIVWDIRLRLSYFLHGAKRYERFNRAQTEGCRFLLAVASAYTGFRLIIENKLSKTLPPRFMILSNHQSLADIPILTFVFSGRILGFVAKRELRRGFPSVSVALREGKHALISRTRDFASARRELVKLARYSETGVCPVVFPEGTRSRTGKVGPFHSAAIRTILDETQMPIVSVAVDGGYRIADFRGLTTNLRNCIYRVKVLSFYPQTNERTEIKRILDKTHEEITEQVDLWRNREI